MRDIIFNMISDDKPKLVDKTTRSLTVQAGKTAHLKCEFRTRQQEWRIVWKVNGKVIEVQKKKRFRQRDRKSSKLWIKKVVKADSGIYECIASNDHGRVRTRLNLTVVGKFVVNVCHFIELSEQNYFV